MLPRGTGPSGLQEMSIQKQLCLLPGTEAGEMAVEVVGEMPVERVVGARVGERVVGALGGERAGERVLARLREGPVLIYADLFPDLFL